MGLSRVYAVHDMQEQVDVRLGMNQSVLSHGRNGNPGAGRVQINPPTRWLPCYLTVFWKKWLRRKTLNTGT